jgi:citrate lyase beta subunit
MHRSYLFAPGHNEKLLRRVFDAGADAVMLDLEDAVPAHAKQQARTMVAAVLADRPAWVRINAVGTERAAADLEAVAGLAAGMTVLDAFHAAGGEAVKLPDGEFDDLPVADRARRLMELAARLPIGAET